MIYTYLESARQAGSNDVYIIGFDQSYFFFQKMTTDGGQRGPGWSEDHQNGLIMSKIEF